jgi:hypothetical protein
MENSKEKLIRVETNLDDFKDIEINSNFHVGKPDNLKDGLELFKKDIGDYDGMWDESDFDWRINNGDIFSYITKDDRIIAWLWSGQKIYKAWDQNGCPVYNTPSFYYTEVEVEMIYTDKYIYGYNIWIDSEYRGIRDYSIGIHGFKHLYELGYNYIVYDIEIWNKPPLMYALKENGLRGNIVDLLDT